MFDRVPDMAAKRAEISPNVVAFRDAGTGRDWTFAEIDRAASGMAHGLREAGYAKGDRLAIICLNRAEFFIALFACQKSGVILCPLNWRQPLRELVVTVRPAAPRGILHDALHTRRARALAAASGMVVHEIETDMARWMRLDPSGPAQAVDGDRPWYLLFTSGTTGRPKAVINTARMAWANTVNIGQAVGLTDRDATVNYLPLFHTAGINLYTLPAFLTGASTTILPRFDAAALLALLASGQVTQFFGVPAIYQAFSLSPGLDAVDWSRARFGCGGAPLSEPLIRFFAARGARVLNGYGLTESGPTVFLMDAEHAEQKIGSVGRPQMLTEVRLDGVPPGSEPAGMAGEVLMRGPNVTPGYYDDPAATAAALDADGWLHTGDVGRWDADGYFHLVDRMTDMFISGGENVYPAEVERILNDHPSVLEAAVVGVPDDRWGEVGAAFLIARPAAAPDPAELRAWCRDRLAAYKVPKLVNLLDDFPRTPAGKVRKPELRKLLT